LVRPAAVGFLAAGHSALSNKRTPDGSACSRAAGRWSFAGACVICLPLHVQTRDLSRPLSPKPQLYMSKCRAAVRVSDGHLLKEGLGKRAKRGKIVKFFGPAAVVDCTFSTNVKTLGFATHREAPHLTAVPPLSVAIPHGPWLRSKKGPWGVDWAHPPLACIKKVQWAVRWLGTSALLRGVGSSTLAHLSAVLCGYSAARPSTSTFKIGPILGQLNRRPTVAR